MASKQPLILLLAALPIVLASTSNAPSPYRKLLFGARQALVVTTDGWNSVRGSLRLFEKSTAGWKQIGDSIPVVVGKNGLGWDGQSQPQGVVAEFTKHEGDGRSPAGIFALGTQFGFDPTPLGKNMKYLPLTSQSECVDDGDSKAYNEVVNRPPISQPDWNSSEKMRQIDQYKLGVIVRYNPRNAKGLGSCIFLHIWRGPDHGTAGCTAMDETALEKIMRTLDQKKKPILIQLPAAAYHDLHEPWHLP